MANFTPVGVEFIGQGIQRYLGDLGRADKAQTNLGKSTQRLAGDLTGLGKNTLGLGANLAKLAAGGVATLTAGIVGLGVASITTASSFQSAFAGVTKTTDGLTDAAGQLTEEGKELRQEFVNLSKEVPVAFESLAAIGELGGQLGIGKDALIDFTETIAALGVSTNLTEEEAASSLARISNIFAIETDMMGENIQRLGSTIVALGNNFATTERDIVAFGERIAGAGQIAGLTQDEVLAIGTALSSVGVEAEAGGTAVQKVLLSMNNAVHATAEGFVDYSDKINKNEEALRKVNAESARLEAQFPGLQSELLAQFEAFTAAGGSAGEFGRQLGDKVRQKAFETALEIQQLTADTQLLRDQHGQPIDTGQLAQFAQVAGLSADQFKQAWQEDASGAFLMFVEGLATQGDNAANVLDELGLADQRLIRAFLSLAGAGDLLSETLALGSQAWSENTALANEAAQRYATTESLFQMFKNTVRALADAVGLQLLPFVDQLIIAGAQLANELTGPVTASIESKVIPAIERMIGTGQALFAAFQAGGAGGLITAMGITPDAIELVNKIIASVTGLGQAVANILTPAFTSLSSGGALELINSAITFMNENFELLQGALLGVGAVVGAGIFAALVAAVTSVITPVNLLLAAAAALGAAWQGNWFGIRDTTAEVWTGLQAIFVQAQAAIQMLTDLWNANWATITAAILTAWEVIQSVFAGIVQVMMGEVWPNLQQAFANIEMALANLGLNWSDVWNALKEATGIVLGAIGALILGLIGTITGLVTGTSEAILTLTEIWSSLMDNLTLIITGITQALTGVSIAWQGIIAGDWAQIWQGLVLVVEGNINTLRGLVGSLLNIMTAPLAAITSFVAGFTDGIVGFFQGMYDTLVGNSIVPDLINDIVGWFTMLPDLILGALSGLTEAVGGIFSGLFGGGEEAAGPAMDLSILQADTGPLQAGLAAVQALVDAITTKLTNLYTVTLIALQETWIVVTTAIVAQLAQLLAMVVQNDQALITISTVTLPQLLTQSNTTTQGMITGFMNVLAVLQQVQAAVMQLISLMAQLAAAAEEAAAAIVKAMEDVADSFEDAGEAAADLEEDIKSLTEQYNKLAAAARDAASAASSVAGAAAAQGLGVRAAMGLGIRAAQGLGLGYTIPAGFPNDSFPIWTTSGEEAMVAPRGQTIDGIIMQRLASLIGGAGAPAGDTIIQVGPFYVPDAMTARIVGDVAAKRVAEQLG